MSASKLKPLAPEVKVEVGLTLNNCHVIGSKLKDSTLIGCNVRDTKMENCILENCDTK